MLADEEGFSVPPGPFASPRVLSEDKVNYTRVWRAVKRTAGKKWESRPYPRHGAERGPPRGWAAGKILGNQLAHFLGDALRRFRDSDKLVLGICNGFQALLKAGLLLPADEDGPVATLAPNAGGRFEDRWVHLQVSPGQCPFLKG